MCCRNRQSIGCIILQWFLFIALLGAAASVAVTWIFVDNEYATEADSPWILVGGVNSTSASFRIHLGSEGSDNGSQDRHLLVVSTELVDISDESIVARHVLGESSNNGNNETTDAMYYQEYDINAVTVTNLEPLVRYYYGVMKESSASSSGSRNWMLEGTFKTPPLENDSPFDFTIATGGNAWTGSQSSVFDTIREDHPDLQLFVHLGGIHTDTVSSSSEQSDAIGTVLSSKTQANLYKSVPLVYAYNAEEWNYASSEQGTAALPLAYPMVFPHYQIIANDSDQSPYQAFTIGTVRFIISSFSDQESNSENINQRQLEWLKSEIEQAERYDFVVWISRDAMVHDAAYTAGVSAARQEINGFISRVVGDPLTGPQNLLVLSVADNSDEAAALAFDDGTNTYFGSDGDGANSNGTTIYSFPLLHSAPLDRMGSPIDGSFSEGCQGIEQERTHQYSTLTFEFPANEAESEACIRIESYRVDPWFTRSKRKLLTKKLCGRFFQPADTSDTSSNTCSIDTSSPVSLALLAIGVAVSAVLAGIACLMIMRQSELQGLTKVFQSFSVVLVAWIGFVVTVMIGFVVPVAKGIEQYDLRPSLLVGMLQSAVMAFILLCYCLCCRSRAQSSRKEGNGEDNIVRPKVIRRTTSSKPSEDDLPLGAIVTGAAKLREEGLTGEGVRVAVIDSGIDEKHQGFSGQVTRKMWYRSGTPLSKDDHGTHVAGTIHMMAPNAQIYDYRVFGRSGNLSVTQAVAKSIRVAADSDCQVINMSLGGPFPSPEIKQAVQYAASKGVVLVCAAGNEGGK